MYITFYFVSVTVLKGLTAFFPFNSSSVLHYKNAVSDLPALDVIAVVDPLSNNAQKLIPFITVGCKIINNKDISDNSFYRLFKKKHFLQLLHCLVRHPVYLTNSGLTNTAIINSHLYEQRSCNKSIF